MSDDIVKVLEAIAQTAARSGLHIETLRVMPAAGVADILYEAIYTIEELEAKLVKAVRELEHARKYGDGETSAWANDVLAELKGEK